MLTGDKVYWRIKNSTESFRYGHVKYISRDLVMLCEFHITTSKGPVHKLTEIEYYPYKE